MKNTSLNTWLGVIAISLGAFILNTSEFVPIGLLSLIAQDFQMSEAKVGFLISMYAWVVALASLPLMLTFSKAELKRLLLCVMALFVISHILSGMANSYAMLIISRIGVAFSHALFWSIATPMAVRAAPEGKQSLALSFVVTGTAIAFIAGLPLGRVIGLYLGWRTTFLVIGAIAFLVMLVIWRVFPTMPSTGAISIRSLPQILKTPHLLGIYLLTILLTTAHFTGYSYIEPFLAKSANFDKTDITLILVAFGAVGFLGSFLFTKYHDNHTLGFTYFAIFGITFSLFILHLASYNPFLMIVACIFWGLCITIFNLTFQSKIIHLVPKATSIAMSMFSGIYNIGIGSGAFIGGIVVDKLNVSFIGYIGGLIAFLGCIYYITAKKPPKAIKQ